MKKKPTLKSIAKMAGLGTTTVSKALRDAPDIAEETKKRVMLIAEQVGYQPDKAAIRLKTGKSNTVVFVMDSDEGVNYMTSELISGIAKALAPTPYSLVLLPYMTNEDPIVLLRHIVESQTADGVILDRIEHKDRRVAYLDQVGFPFTTYGRTSLDIQHAYYDFDCFAFGRDAVRTLEKLKCKRICMILSDTHMAYVKLTEDGFYDGIEETGLEAHSVNSPINEDTIDAIAAITCSAMKEDKRPDGFVCASIKAALGVLTGLKTAGFSLGEGVELVVRQSITNELRFIDKPIHYIADDCKAAGFAVASSLVKLIDGEPVTNHQLVEYTDVVGKNVLDS